MKKPTNWTSPAITASSSLRTLHLELGLELGPARVQPFDGRLGRGERLEPRRERLVVGRHRGIRGGRLAGFEPRLGLEDACLHVVPLALLEVAEPAGAVGGR